MNERRIAGPCFWCGEYHIGWSWACVRCYRKKEAAYAKARELGLTRYCDVMDLAWQYCNEEKMNDREKLAKLLNNMCQMSGPDMIPDEELTECICSVLSRREAIELVDDRYHGIIHYIYDEREKLLDEAYRANVLNEHPPRKLKQLDLFEEEQ